MSQNKNVQDPEVKVEEALSQTQNLLVTYKNPIIYTAIAILVVAGAIFSYHHLVTLPKKQEAMSQMFTAEQQFRANNFEMALNGDGNTLGFKDIINEYGSKAGEAVYFYAGVSALQLGNYQEAIDFLKKYKGTDPIISARATACIGDAYAGLGNLKAAVSEYLAASKTDDSMLAANYLLKAGIINEEMGNNKEALKLYETIKTKYPQSPEAYEINKYISRLEMVSNN